MTTEYHPEVDDLPLLSDDNAGRYSYVIGSLN